MDGWETTGRPDEGVLPDYTQRIRFRPPYSTGSSLGPVVETRSQKRRYFVPTSSGGLTLLIRAVDEGRRVEGFCAVGMTGEPLEPGPRSGPYVEPGKGPLTLRQSDQTSLETV